MFVLNIAVIGTALSQSLVLDGGILLERSGSLFLSRQKSHHNVIITRPVPRNPFLELDISNCDVDTCQEFFKSQRWNKKECIDNLGETRLTSLLTAIDDRFTRELLDLKEEAEFAKAHEARLNKRFAGAPALVLAAANLGLKIKNTADIVQLKSVSLAQGRNIDKLTKNFAKLESNMAVSLNATYERVSKIEQDLCRLNNQMIRDRIQDWATTTVSQYINEVDYEVAALQQGQIPSRVEWNRLFSAACWGSCVALQPAECEAYCEGLLRELPLELKPELLGLNITDSGLDVFIRLSFPVIESSPTKLFSANPFGIIVKTEESNQLVAPDIAPYATELGGEFYEVDRFSCLSSRKNMICRHSAVMSASCLREVKNCNIKRTTTQATCSFAFDNNGVVVYAAEEAIFRNRTVLADIGSAHERFNGFRYFAESETDSEVFCSGNLLIKIPKTPLVSSSSTQMDLRAAANTNFTFAVFNTNPDSLVDEVDERLDELEDIVEDNYTQTTQFSILTSASLLLVLFTTLGLLTWQFCLRVRGLARTVNSALKPLI
jgi:hypothetical protein